MANDFAVHPALRSGACAKTSTAAEAAHSQARTSFWGPAHTMLSPSDLGATSAISLTSTCSVPVGTASNYFSSRDELFTQDGRWWIAEITQAGG